MKKRPLVSIGLPVYNGERYLRATLDSLIAQTYGDFELIISDNASTDGTEAICLEYSASDSRIRYHRADRNIGAARNYQRVFELSSSPYFKWANADDVVAPQLVERCLEALQRNPDVILAYSRAELIDAEGFRISEYDDNLNLASPSASQRFVDVLEHLRLVNVIYGVVRSDVLRRTGLMGSYISSDCVLVAELALHGKFYEVPETLFSRRLHPDAYGSQTDPTKRLQFYNPQTKRRVALFRWRHLWEYGRAIERSRVPVREKTQMWARLLRTTIWQRRPLAAEAWLAVKALVGRDDPSVIPVNRSSSVS